MTHVPPDRRLSRLDEHQAAILNLIRRGERLLRSSDRDAPALARTRWELARAMLAHEAFARRELFDPVNAGGSPGSASAARRLQERNADLAQAFRTHLARWSKVSVVDRWEEYHPAALAMIARIRDNLARERREVARLLADQAVTARPVTPPRA